MSDSVVPPVARVGVIGAGVVGACIAYALRKRGFDVVLMDRGEPGEGCSFGNLGAISMSSIVPLATPSVIKSAPSMLGDPNSPLFLPLRYLPKAAPWLARFVMSARPSVVAKNSAELVKLHAGAVQAHAELTREVGVPELLVHRGQLHLYPSKAALQDDAASWALRRQHGLSFRELDAAGIAEMEPRIGSRYPVGIFLSDDATILNPLRYVQAIVAAFVSAGGQVWKRDVRSLKRREGGGWSIQSEHGHEAFSQMVVAAGAWSKQLLQGVGIHVSLESQRGYHVQFSGGSSLVSRSILLTDKKVFLAPMEGGLRIGGTVEIAGLQSPPNTKRSLILEGMARDLFPELEGVPTTHWMGHRPCMPDSIPKIGSSGLPGLHMAVGHGHLGLTDSALSANKIVDSMLEEVGVTGRLN